MTEVSVAKEDVAKAGELVVLKSVNKHFGALHVLQDIDLTIASGEVVVVIGPSGSGKSTLCRTINRLETTDSGTIVCAAKCSTVSTACSFSTLATSLRSPVSPTTRGVSSTALRYPVDKLSSTTTRSPRSTSCRTT